LKISRKPNRSVVQFNPAPSSKRGSIEIERLAKSKGLFPADAAPTAISISK